MSAVLLEAPPPWRRQPAATAPPAAHVARVSHANPTLPLRPGDRRPGAAAPAGGGVSGLAGCRGWLDGFRRRPGSWAAEHGALGSWSPGRGAAGLGCSRLDPGEASGRRLPVAGELVLGWLSSAAAGGSNAALDSPSVSRPGRRSPTLGASVAGLSGHTPPKWLSLGPSDTGHGAEKREVRNRAKILSRRRDLCHFDVTMSRDSLGTDLPRISITDVYRLVQTGSSAPRSKREKGYKMYLSSYIDNYEGKITFENSTPVHIAMAECSCVAGTALCNHNVALLYQTAHYSTLKLKAVPPVLSCTETEQRWHKPRTMGVKPGRVGDMVFISTRPKSRQYTVVDGVRSNRYKAVRGDLPDPDVLKVDEAYKDFTADIAPLITTMAISSDVPLVNSAYGPVQEGSPISTLLLAGTEPVKLEGPY
ncbi:hypothetical protein N1851_002500 [Merluccius polli]|uniref:SWIM-type domain-containing protein n=1 Tax=Merluccius polli TaxID=89951 RepID=A0AA47NBI0_MERPO|nr:hypothetical protein N1851_002500 [Merluccius polli]